MEDTVILIEADYLAAVIDSSGLGQRHPGDIDCGEGGRKGGRCGQGNRAQNQEQHSEHQSMGQYNCHPPSCRQFDRTPTFTR
jgi:hypothetical protein